MEAVLFFIAAIGATGGAIGVVASRNPFYSVLALIAHLFSLAVLFLLLTSAFIAAAQVVVYAGAVMVLYVFVVAYVGSAHEAKLDPVPGQRLFAGLLAFFLFVEISAAVLSSALKALSTKGPDVPAGATHWSVRIRTEHGTYVKEVVNGESGATKPSLAELLGLPCRCLELDVLAILDVEGKAEPPRPARVAFGENV